MQRVQRDTTFTYVQNKIAVRKGRSKFLFEYFGLLKSYS